MSDEQKIVPFPSGDAPASAGDVAAPGVVGGGEKMPAEVSASVSAVVAPAAAAEPIDPAVAFTTKSGDFEYYFDESTAKFWMRNKASAWIDLSEGGFKRHLKKERGLRDKPPPNAVISPIDEVVSYVEQNSRVASAGLFTGYRAGVHWVAGKKILIREDPVIIEPVRGEWPVLRQFFDGLLVGEEPLSEDGKTVTIDQRPYFYGWLQHAVQCYYESRRATGLAVCIAGDPNCGKSFLALILRWILGGRVAKPYAAMIGKDNFNNDMAEAVLQLVDDENQADTRHEARLKFAGEIKQIVANNEFRLRAMHRDGFAIEVLRRLVVLVNLQASRMMVLPPLDGDINDKINLFKGYARARPARSITIETPAEEACWPAPMPTRTEAEKEAYRATVRAELPAFLFWLLREFKMPSEVTGGRFVVRHYHHPFIVSELHELSPHVRVWELILRSKVVLHDYVPSESGGQTVMREEWRGSASEMERLLTGTDSKLTMDEKREIPKPNWLGQRLKLCAEHFGEGICRLEMDKLKRKMWVLRPRKEDREGDK